MSKSKSMTDALGDALRANWGLFMFQGIVMLLLGIAALAAPGTASLATDIFLGWLFVISGVVGVIAMFSSRGMPAFLWTLLTAALSLAAGIMLLWKPEAGVVSVTLVLTAFFVAEGIFQIVGSFAYRDVLPGSWGWMLFSGIADLALVAVIILGWPASASWTLGILVGVNLLTSGIAMIFTAVESRKVVRSLVGAPA